MKNKVDTSPEALAEELLGRPYAELEEDEQRALHRVASTEIELDPDELDVVNVKLGDRACIGCRKGADDATAAGGEHQLWPGDQEHGRRKHRQTQVEGVTFHCHGNCIYSAALKPEMRTASAQRRDSACA